jgi:hypothetical protein
MSDVHDRNLKQLTDQMRHIDELALVVLKGHLVLEEQLERILGKFLFHPEYLEEANLRFAQKVALARSMSLDEQANSMWELLLAMNGLRNELAHALHSEKRQRRFDRVKSLYMAESDASAAEVVGCTDHELAANAIALILGFLGSFEEEVVRFKDWVSTLDRIVNPHRHKSAETDH